MQIHIENMTCGGCVRGVSAAIRAVDPVAEIAADPALRQVTVQSARPGAAFLPALEAAGFNATIR